MEKFLTMVKGFLLGVLLLVLFFSVLLFAYTLVNATWSVISTPPALALLSNTSTQSLTLLT